MSPSPVQPSIPSISLYRKLLIEFMHRHRRRLVLALSMNLLVGLSITFQNLVPKYIIDEALLKPGRTLEERKRLLFGLAFLYVFLGLFGRALLWNASLRVFGRVREAFLFALRSKVFRHINQLCLNFHARRQSGELFSYLLGSPIAQLQQFYTEVMLVAPCHGIAILFTLAFLGSWNLLLTGIMILAIAAHQVILWRARKRMQEINTDYQNTESRVSGRVSDLLRGFRTVKLHAHEDQTVDDFEAGAGLIRDKSYFRAVASHMEYVKQEGILYLGYALLCLVAGWEYLAGRISAGELTAYLTTYIGLQGPLGYLFQIAVLSGGAQASVARLSELLQETSTTPDPIGEPQSVPLQGEIELAQVTFAYTNTVALQDVSVRIPYGQSVALVGPSGSGKSTFVQLILRFYDPTAGFVRIGGVDLRTCAGREIRRCFGVVPQDPYLFNSTVRDNLRIAKPDAEDDELVMVCRQANAWEFIERLPQRLDEPIREGGTSLSGGQRQRLAIARALLASPHYFIFDEATSALDMLSERLIREALEEITRVRTTIFIAHRLASIEHCQRILVLSEGRIVQDGSFAELAETGLFHELWKLRPAQA